MGVIDATGVFKVFGHHSEHAVERLKSGESRDKLREEGTTAAVIDASFEVQAGEIFVVMGLSGSGKSTLIRMVNGLLEATAGSMKIHGEEITTMSAKALRKVRSTQVSMVFQHFALFPHRSVADNAAYGLETRGVSRHEQRKQATRALEMVGLKGWEEQLPGQLSGGMQQRVGLARALAAGTDIMLMDEAFSALDPLIRREMQDQLIELQSTLQKTILFITHDLNEAMRMGDRIAMMRDGRIVQIGTAEEILNNPANDYVAQFIQDVDRSRVLTASAVMERPPAVLGAEQGPRVAHKLIRENQVSELFVVDRQHRLVGVVFDSDVARAVQDNNDSLSAIMRPDPVSVGPATVLAEFLTDAARSSAALPVVDEENRLVGVVPNVTLLNALGEGHVPTAPHDAAADEPDQREEVRS